MEIRMIWPAIPWNADDPEDDMRSELFEANSHKKEHKLELVMINTSRLNVHNSVKWINNASGSDLPPNYLWNQCFWTLSNNAWLTRIQHKTRCAFENIICKMLTIWWLWFSIWQQMAGFKCMPWVSFGFKCLQQLLTQAPCVCCIR